MKNPPSFYPETVAQDDPLNGHYELRESSFWTCGFFPGSLYTLLERFTLYPGSNFTKLSPPLLSLCRAWSAPLHAMSTRTDTHDLGFIVASLRIDYELTGDATSLASLITAAHSLASRYVMSAGAIRSWDLLRKKDVSIVTKEENCIVIIDSVCNLDLLFYASFKSGNGALAVIARAHALTLLNSHLRPELVSDEASRTGFKGPVYSSYHVANLDPRTGSVKGRLTAQGYANDSTWARGQAWAILGFAETYQWTKEKVFLAAACGCAEYFLQRLWTENGYGLPMWDFDAPVEDPKKPVLDSSASAIAANGLLIISEALIEDGQSILAEAFREAAMGVVKGLLREALAGEKALFVRKGESEDEAGLSVQDVEIGKSFDAILKNGTANNNAGANRRYWNHGLVYGDYYLLQFGNRLLRMGLA